MLHHWSPPKSEILKPHSGFNSVYAFVVWGIGIVIFLIGVVWASVRTATTWISIPHILKKLRKYKDECSRHTYF